MRIPAIALLAGATAAAAANPQRRQFRKRRCTTGRDPAWSARQPGWDRDPAAQIGHLRYESLGLPGPSQWDPRRPAVRQVRRRNRLARPPCARLPAGFVPARAASRRAPAAPDSLRGGNRSRRAATGPTNLRQKSAGVETGRRSGVLTRDCSEDRRHGPSKAHDLRQIELVDIPRSWARAERPRRPIAISAVRSPDSSNWQSWCSTRVGSRELYQPRACWVRRACSTRARMWADPLSPPGKLTAPHGCTPPFTRWPSDGCGLLRQVAD